MGRRPSEVLQSVAANVRALREGLGLTQAELADQTDLQQRQIQRIEGGEANFAIMDLIDLANFFDVAISNLLRPRKMRPRPRGRPRKREA